MDLETVVGVPIEFDGADGKTYKLGILSLREIAEFTRWVKFKDYYEAKEVGIPEDDLKATYNECKEKVLSFGDKVTLAALRTPEGMMKALYLSLRIFHPEVKENEIARVMNVNVFMGELIDEFTTILGLGGKKEGN